MIRSALHRKYCPAKLRLALAACAATLFALLSASSLNAQTVATYDFEDGTAQGWSSFNNATAPVATTAAAYTGSHSLLTTTGSAGQGGPSIALNSILLPGAQYTITGYVQLTAGEAASNANFTIRRSDPTCSGGTCYDTIGSYTVAVSPSGWAQIGGTYTVSTTETAVTLYAQLVGATTAQSFYLDDVVITETAPPPGGSAVATFTFQDGGLDGWTPFGSTTLTNAVSPIADPNGNTHSLLASNRTAGYMGPSLNLLTVNNVVANATYQVSAYVLLATPDSTNPTVSLSTKSTDCADTSGAYNTLGTSAALSSTAWTKVQGTLSFSNLPGAPTGLVLYFQSTSATDSFYISDVVIGELAPPPLSPSQQDNTGISSTFEDGGLDGWSGRISATATNTTATANTGSHSLFISGRSANYDGAQISVNDKMYVGSVYNVSVWVKLAVNDNSTHILNMSLQTTLSGNTSYNSVTGYPGTSVLADGNWHQISIKNYTMASPYDQGQAYLYLQTVPPNGNDLVSFYIDDFQLAYVPPAAIQTGIPSLYQTLSSYFPIGTTVDLSDLSGPHSQLLIKHFDSITPGNEMKWSSVENSLGNYTFGDADKEVGLAVCNSIRIRGHNLVWATGAQTPAYATGDGTSSPANQALVTANIQEHIQSEVQHFGSKVYAWDVVNEPIDPNQPDCLVHGPFYQVLGKSYIDVAFQAARKYTPAGTKLFLNEYSTADPNRLACLVTVLHDLRSRGIPIDGIGHETHSSINYPSILNVVHSVNLIADYFPGIDQQITEFDLSVYNGGDITSNYGLNIPPSVLAEQGWLYKTYFDAFKELKGKISAVTIWGMADDDTWLDSFPVTRTEYPLPFDMGLQAKPAYWGIVDGTQLPGAGLTLTGTTTTLGGGNLDVTLTATNGSIGPAYATKITAYNLKQTAGPACKIPWVGAPSNAPIVLGDIPINGSANTVFHVNLGNCDPAAQFQLKVGWSSATYETGTISVNF
jgi:endo-1,4-beta-xylanase